MTAKKNNQAKSSVGRVFVFQREFNAPRRLVFAAWTDPIHVAQWWGPREFTNPVCEWDARPGGAIRIHMRGPDGHIYPMTGVMKEVVEPEKIVFLSAVPDERGNPLLEVLTTVTLADLGDRTRLTLEAKITKSSEPGEQMIAGMDEGWSQSLERLADCILRLGRL